jgi:predicted negative regulator of RcsB-dependent stress response
LNLRAQQVPFKTTVLAHASHKGRAITVDQQTKAALKHDQFVDTTTHGLDWVSENRQTVIVGAAALVLVILLAIGGSALYNYRSEAASSAFGAAMQDYQTPLAQPGQPVPPGTKTYPSIAARAKAANAEFVAVADKYSFTSVGKVALYFAGLTEVEAGENASAESTLQKVASGWNGDLAALARLSLAQLYRQTGRDPQAIDLYNELSVKPTSTVPAGLAQLQLAELYEAEGKPEAAKKIYAQLKDKDAKSPAAQIAAQKLNPAPAMPGGLSAQ